MRILSSLVCLLLAAPLAAEVAARGIPALAQFIAAEAPLSVREKYIGPRHYFDYQLWTLARPWSYADQLAVRVVVLRRFSLEKTVREMVEEAGELHGVTGADAERMRSFLDAAISADLEVGDRIDFLWDPARGLAIYRNDVLRGAAGDKVLAGWIMDFFCHEEERGTPLLEHKALPAVP